MDKLYKVRPIIDSVRQRCLQLELEENLCIDEQIIPFRGKLSIKQYIKGKPSPWGLKVYALCGKSGMPYDFIVYQGATTELDGDLLKCFGFCSAIVLHLSQRIPMNEINHKLYFDNFFSSYACFEVLLDRNILGAGTIRVNRFKDPPMLPAKEFESKGRGFAQDVISRDKKVIVTKWYDNKTVHLASNFVGIGQSDIARRWDKKEKIYIDINRPEVVRLYNYSMGGVDLLDQMIQYYRIFVKSTKWTLRAIMHFTDLAVCASWMEYRKDCSIVGVPEKEQMDLLAFRIDLAETLVNVNKTNKNKVGRPSENSVIAPPSKKRNVEKCPPVDVRRDCVGHMPIFSNEKNSIRCKFTNCDKKTLIMCEKCKVHLCITRERNCFKDFHSK